MRNRNRGVFGQCSHEGFEDGSGSEGYELVDYEGLVAAGTTPPCITPPAASSCKDLSDAEEESGEADGCLAAPLPLVVTELQPPDAGTEHPARGAAAATPSCDGAARDEQRNGDAASELQPDSEDEPAADEPAAEEDIHHMDPQDHPSLPMPTTTTTTPIITSLTSTTPPAPARDPSPTHNSLVFISDTSQAGSDSGAVSPARPATGPPPAGPYSEPEPEPMHLLQHTAATAEQLEAALEWEEEAPDVANMQAVIQDVAVGAVTAAIVHAPAPISEPATMQHASAAVPGSVAAAGRAGASFTPQVSATIDASESVAGSSTATMSAMQAGPHAPVTPASPSLKQHAVQPLSMPAGTSPSAAAAAITTARSVVLRAEQVMLWTLTLCFLLRIVDMVADPFQRFAAHSYSLPLPPSSPRMATLSRILYWVLPFLITVPILLRLPDHIRDWCSWLNIGRTGSRAARTPQRATIQHTRSGTQRSMHAGQAGCACSAQLRVCAARASRTVRGVLCFVSQVRVFLVQHMEQWLLPVLAVVLLAAHVILSCQLVDAYKAVQANKAYSTQSMQPSSHPNISSEASHIPSPLSNITSHSIPGVATPSKMCELLLPTGLSATTGLGGGGAVDIPADWVTLQVVINPEQYDCATLQKAMSSLQALAELAFISAPAAAAAASSSLPGAVQLSCSVHCDRQNEHHESHGEHHARHDEHHSAGAQCLGAQQHTTGSTDPPAYPIMLVPSIHPPAIAKPSTLANKPANGLTSTPASCPDSSVAEPASTPAAHSASGKYAEPHLPEQQQQQQQAVLQATDDVQLHAPGRMIAAHVHDSWRPHIQQPRVDTPQAGSTASPPTSSQDDAASPAAEEQPASVVVLAPAGTQVALAGPGGGNTAVGVMPDPVHALQAANAAVSTTAVDKECAAGQCANPDEVADPEAGAGTPAPGDSGSSTRDSSNSDADSIGNTLRTVSARLSESLLQGAQALQDTWDMLEPRAAHAARVVAEKVKQQGLAGKLGELHAAAKLRAAGLASRVVVQLRDAAQAARSGAESTATCTREAGVVENSGDGDGASVHQATQGSEGISRADISTGASQQAASEDHEASTATSQTEQVLAQVKQQMQQQAALLVVQASELRDRLAHRMQQGLQAAPGMVEMVQRSTVSMVSAGSETAQQQFQVLKEVTHQVTQAAAERLKGVAEAFNEEMRDGEIAEQLARTRKAAGQKLQEAAFVVQQAKRGSVRAAKQLHTRLKRWKRATKQALQPAVEHLARARKATASKRRRHDHSRKRH